MEPWTHVRVSDMGMVMEVGHLLNFLIWGYQYVVGKMNMDKRAGVLQMKPAVHKGQIPLPQNLKV